MRVCGGVCMYVCVILIRLHNVLWYKVSTLLLGCIIMGLLY